MAAFSMTLICGRFCSERTITDPGAFEQEQSASEFAHGVSIRLLLLAHECHVKSKFHVVSDCYVPRYEPD
jgi:hypothetical protein